MSKKKNPSSDCLHSVYQTLVSKRTQEVSNINHTFSTTFLSATYNDVNWRSQLSAIFSLHIQETETNKSVLLQLIGRNPEQREPGDDKTFALSRMLSVVFRRYLDDKEDVKKDRTNIILDVLMMLRQCDEQPKNMRVLQEWLKILLSKEYQEYLQSKTQPDLYTTLTALHDALALFIGYSEIRAIYFHDAEITSKVLEVARKAPATIYQQFHFPPEDRGRSGPEEAKDVHGGSGDARESVNMKPIENPHMIFESTDLPQAAVKVVGAKYVVLNDYFKWLKATWDDYIAVLQRTTVPKVMFKNAMLVNMLADIVYLFRFSLYNWSISGQVNDLLGFLEAFLEFSQERLLSFLQTHQYHQAVTFLNNHMVIPTRVVLRVIKHSREFNKHMYRVNSVLEPAEKVAVLQQVLASAGEFFGGYSGLKQMVRNDLLHVNVKTFFSRSAISFFLDPENSNISNFINHMTALYCHYAFLGESLYVKPDRSTKNSLSSTKKASPAQQVSLINALSEVLWFDERFYRFMAEIVSVLRGMKTNLVWLKRHSCELQQGLQQALNQLFKTVLSTLKDLEHFLQINQETLENLLVDGVPEALYASVHQDLVTRVLDASLSISVHQLSQFSAEKDGSIAEKEMLGDSSAELLANHHGNAGPTTPKSWSRGPSAPAQHDAIGASEQESGEKSYGVSSFYSPDRRTHSTGELSKSSNGGWGLSGIFSSPSRSADAEKSQRNSFRGNT